MVNSDIAIYDNVSIYINDVNKELQSILTSIGIDTILLPSYSPELNPIEFVFNIITQWFRSMGHESNLNSNDNILRMIYKVIDSIIPDIIFSYY